MTKLLKPAVFLAGLAMLSWIAAGYVGTSALALSMVLLIAGCYLAGGAELRRYQQATDALQAALADPAMSPTDLADWLGRLPASLRHAVRQRIEGERVPLPAPALAPYLVGLLVLLGMLGTLLGMMTTLRGTGLALENTADLAAMRAALAAPVKGLAFAFGTSIAGVAASAMLGLLSALCRRDRALAAQSLDAAIATGLRPHSMAHRRDHALRLQQQQTDAMPALVEQLSAAMAAMERQSVAAHERQIAQQAQFLERTEALHARLAASVETSLKGSVAESARAASASLQPVVESTMAALAQHAASLHGDVGRSMERHLEALSGRLQASTTQIAGVWTDAATQQRSFNQSLMEDVRASLHDVAGRFEQRSIALVDTVCDRFEAASAQASAAWTDALAQQVAATGAIVQANAQALEAATAALETRGASLVERVHASQAALQDTLGTQMQAQARDTLGEIARLLHDAAEAPKAAAAVIAELRQNLSESLARDTAMLEERGRLLATVETLLGAVNHASAEQRAAVDALISTSADAMERVATRFGEHVEQQTGRLDEAATRIAAGAVEVTSLGDVLGATVARFADTNGELVARLQAVESALGQSLARSDEQLAYYVAQARDVVDLSVLAQKQIIGELQQLARQRAGAEAA
jgi:hypothetical protein